MNDKKDKFDDDLIAGLRLARKKALNFVLVCKGTNVLKAFVQKKTILSGQVKEARTATGGNLVIEGVVQQVADEMVFNVVGDQPSLRIAAFRDYIKDNSGLKIKPVFKVVKELPTVVDDGPDDLANDLEGDENETEEGTGNDAGNVQPNAPAPPAAEIPSQEIPPPPPVAAEPTNEIPEAPPGPSTEDLEKIAALRAKVAELTPTIKKAATTAPTRAQEMMSAVAAFKTAAKSEVLKDAQETYAALAKILKEMMTPTVTPPVPNAPPPPQPVATNEESEQNEAQTQEPTPSTENPAKGRWEQEIDRLEGDYLENLPKADSKLASQMRTIFAYATEQAEAGNYDKALAGLKRLEPLIEQASTGTGAASEVAAGIVEKRKFLVSRWSRIPSEINDNLRPIEVAVEDQVPSENANELVSEIKDYLKSFYGNMQNAIDDAIQTGDNKFKKASQLISSFRDEVLANELVRHVDANRLGVKSKVQAILLKALDEMQANLAG